VTDDVWRLGVGGLRRAYERRELAPLEVVESLARRIEQVNPDVRAFTTLLLDEAVDEARAQSEQLARGDSRGPLHGIPVAVKELFDVGGAITTYGSLVFAGNRPAADAVAVRNLRAAGAIVLGLTRSHEFGWGITTQHHLLGGTRNPWDRSRVPGGSSGGSAAALAAGLVPLALGTDTGGSIRVPACYCGITGLKPSYGRVSLTGAVPLAPSLDHAGPMARDVGDLAVALDVLAPGRGGLPPARSPRLTVGIVPDLHRQPLAPDHLKVFERAVAALQSVGVDIRQLAFPGADRIRRNFTAIQMAEAHHVHASTLGIFPHRSADYGADVRTRLEDAAAVTLDTYLTARDGARQVARHFTELLGEADVLLTPVTSDGPSLVESPDYVLAGGQAVPFRDVVMEYTVPQNVAGLPACVVPAGFDDDDIPVGVQLTSGHGREDLALHAGGLLEQALAGPARRWPPA